MDRNLELAQLERHLNTVRALRQPPPPVQGTVELFMLLVGLAPKPAIHSRRRYVVCQRVECARANTGSASSWLSALDSAAKPQRHGCTRAGASCWPWRTTKDTLRKASFMAVVNSFKPEAVSLDAKKQELLAKKLKDPAISGDRVARAGGAPAVAIWRWCIAQLNVVQQSTGGAHGDDDDNGYDDKPSYGNLSQYKIFHDFI